MDDVTTSSRTMDFSYLTLKPDHMKRPVWACPNGYDLVFLNTLI